MFNFCHVTYFIATEPDPQVKGTQSHEILRYVAPYEYLRWNLLLSGALVYFFLTLKLCTLTVWGCFRLKELQIVINSKYRATKVAGESLIAQINSQCKLATLRCENRKILYENEI
jgi:hypothetical protein